MQHAISAGHEITLQVAKEVLLDGGNAFDAAIAAFLAMFITEPCMASAGGNGFALTKAVNDDIKFFDFFSQTPAHNEVKEVEFYPILVDFGNETEEFFIGLGAAAIPGSIAGIFAIHERYGSIPISELTSPAIQLAKEGVLLNAFQAYDLKLLASIFWQDPSVRNIFFKGENIKQEGDRLSMPEMADFLDFISQEGERGFYHGEISKIVAADCKLRGGFLTRSDFENYKVNVFDPLKIKYKDKYIFLPNGPSKGGALLALMLSMANEETYSLAFAIKKVQEINKAEKDLVYYFDQYFPNQNFNLDPSINAYRGTSHFNILDKYGNAISLTSSMGEGCGYFIPGTTMHLNNMLGEIFLLPNGKYSWIPNRRMHSMMTPTLVTDQMGILEFLAGSGGASRIPYAIGQVIYQIYEQQKSLLQATETSRYHYQNGFFQLEYGAEWPIKGEKILQWDKKSLYFGGVHSIQIVQDGVFAIGDERRHGVAEVF